MRRDSKRSRRPKGGAKTPQGRDSRRGRRGSEKSSTKGGGFDWSVADDEDEYDDEDDRNEGSRYDDEDEEQAPRRRRSKKRAPRQARKTLMDLCTPIFAYASLLPSDPSAGQPDYRQFRDRIVSDLNRMPTEAAENGIEAEDVNHACYALSFFLDTQIAQSEWTGKMQWSAEPLGIVLQQDPEGGVNFFRRLDGLGDRHKAVKEVYLVCLALGFRGKYAEQDAATQAAQIADIRQKIVRSINPEPIDKKTELFPEAYEPADAIEDEIPPPPTWWWAASFGFVGVVVIVWVLLFLWAGRSPAPADEVVTKELEQALEYVAPMLPDDDYLDPSLDEASDPAETPDPEDAGGAS
jgi:type VI secretion system protein ImpK